LSFWMYGCQAIRLHEVASQVEVGSAVIWNATDKQSIYWYAELTCAVPVSMAEIVSTARAADCVPKTLKPAEDC
jgi:hypothetical protein